MVTTRSSSQRIRDSSPLALRTRDDHKSVSPATKRKSQPSETSSPGAKRPKKSDEKDFEAPGSSEVRHSVPAQWPERTDLGGGDDSAQPSETTNFDDNSHFKGGQKRLPSLEAMFAPENTDRRNTDAPVNLGTSTAQSSGGDPQTVVDEPEIENSTKYSEDRAKSGPSQCHEQLEVACTSSGSNINSQVKFDNEQSPITWTLTPEASPVVAEPGHEVIAETDSDDEPPQQFTSKNQGAMQPILNETSKSRRKTRPRGKRRLDQDPAGTLLESTLNLPVESRSLNAAEAQVCFTFEPKPDSKTADLSLPTNTPHSDALLRRGASAVAAFEENDGSLIHSPMRQQDIKKPNMKMVPKSKGSSAKFRAGILDGRKRQWTWGGRNTFLRPIGT